MAKSKLKRHYCDSGVFISFLNEEPENLEKSKNLLLAAEANHIELFTSTHTMAEVVYIKDDSQNEEQQEKAIANLFNNHWISLIGFDREAAEVSRYLCRKFQLKPFDALHLATAIRNKMDYFDTFDNRLLKNIKHHSPEGLIGYPPHYSDGVIVQEPSVEGWTNSLL
jgi:predicted nucleic acid-binding protein